MYIAGVFVDPLSSLSQLN